MRYLYLIVVLSFLLFSANAEERRGGVLPSGLRYHLVSDSSWSAYKSEVRLFLPVGSLSETGSTGVAHFIEHLAFRGSRHFPALAVRQFVERQGGAFGYDLNALTGHDRTIYMLSTPQETLDTALLIVKDWLYDLTLSPKDIESEKGVILEEIAQFIPNDPADDLMIGTGVHGHRMPLGTPLDVKKMKREEILRFYRKWYHPSIAHLVVASALPLDSLEQLIRGVFSTSKIEKPIKAPLYSPLEYNSKVYYRTTQDTLYRAHQVRYIMPFPSIASQEERLLSIVLNDMLRKIDGGSLSIWHYLTGTSMMELSIRSTDEKEIARQLARSLSLLERVRLSGLCQSEEYIKGFLALYSIGKTPFYSPLGAVEAIVESLQRDIPLCGETLDKAIQRILNHRETNIIIYNQGRDATLKADDFYTSLFTPLDSLPTLTLAEEGIKLSKNIKPLSQLFVKKIKPLFRVYLPVLGITIATYPQDHKLIIKTTKAGATQVLSQNPGGTMLLPSSNYDAIASLIDMEDEGDALYLNGLSVGSTLSLTHHGFYGFCEKPESLSKLLAYVYHKIRLAQATSGIESSKEPSILKGLIERDPSHLVASLRDTILCNVASLPASKDSIPPSEVTKMYRRLYGSIAKGVTIISTPLDIDSVLSAFGATLAELVHTDSRSLFKQQNSCLLPKPILETYPKRGSVTAHYLSYGIYEPSLRNNLILKIVREKLRTDQLDLLRHREGIVYSPAVSLEVRLGRYLLELENNTQVEHIPRLKKLLEDSVGSFTLSQSRLAEIKKGFSTNRKIALANEDEADWMDIISQLIDRGETVEDFEHYDEILESITVEEVIAYWQYLQKTMSHQWIFY